MLFHGEVNLHSSLVHLLLFPIERATMLLLPSLGFIVMVSTGALLSYLISLSFPSVYLTLSFALLYLSCLDDFLLSLSFPFSSILRLHNLSFRFTFLAGEFYVDIATISNFIRRTDSDAHNIRKAHQDVGFNLSHCASISLCWRP